MAGVKDVLSILSSNFLAFVRECVTMAMLLAQLCGERHKDFASALGDLLEKAAHAMRCDCLYTFPCVLPSPLMML